MALKFLNKKGWHTGSLRNVENVWKAEQKHEAEQKKLEEIRKQIQEERERSEFRILQEQAGLVPKQERLEFLYDSGLSVGKGSSTGFKALESLPKTDSATVSSSSAQQQQQPSVPGALFEEKPQSANDAWRKLHSDPLLLIRQREQEALARVKNNPIQMAMIRKSVEVKEHKKTRDGKELRKKHRHKKSKHQRHSPSKHQSDEETVTAVEGKRQRNTSDCKGSQYGEISSKAAPSAVEALGERSGGRKRNSDSIYYNEKRRSSLSDQKTLKNEDHNSISRDAGHSRVEKYYSEGRRVSDNAGKGREDRTSQVARCNSSDLTSNGESHKRRNPVKLSEEERAARLREMQMDAELHEESRWKRLKKAEENDAREALHSGTSGGRNFLDVTRKSIYGAEKGGSSTIEESVRRRTHYLQDRSEVGEGHAFRR